jgi:hypothetical protein
MPADFSIDNASFDYAVIRVVPRVEREEFLNVGVVLYSSTQAFLKARIELDKARLLAFAPHLDLEVVENSLQTIPRICEGGKNAGPIGELPQRARFHWLVAPRSTVIQLSPVHSGVCADLEKALDDLMNRLVRLDSGDG